MMMMMMSMLMLCSLSLGVVVCDGPEFLHKLVCGNAVSYTHLDVYKRQKCPPVKVISSAHTFSVGELIASDIRLCYILGLVYPDIPASFG